MDRWDPAHILKLLLVLLFFDPLEDSLDCGLS